MKDDKVAYSKSRLELITLVAIVGLSLALTATTNRLVGRVLISHAPQVSGIATAAIPSFIVIACLYFALGSRRALQWVSIHDMKISGTIKFSAIWLLLWLTGLSIAAAATGHWITYALGTSQLLAFLLFGPAGEELLFRGLVFEHARRIWPTTPMPAILLSTAAFSMHHIWLQAAPAGLLVAQVLFTIPMGVLFATLRERTGCLWPAFLLHVATNLPSAF